MGWVAARLMPWLAGMPLGCRDGTRQGELVGVGARGTTVQIRTPSGLMVQTCWVRGMLPGVGIGAGITGMGSVGISGGGAGEGAVTTGAAGADTGCCAAGAGVEPAGAAVFLLAEALAGLAEGLAAPELDDAERAAGRSDAGSSVTPWR